MHPISTIIPILNPGVIFSLTLLSYSRACSSEDQLIVVDNLSQDNSINFLEQYRHILPCDIAIISEADSGIYDAINKGISLATKSYIMILHAGDIVNSIAYIKAKNSFSQDLEPILIFGRNKFTGFVSSSSVTPNIKSLYFSMPFTHSNFLFPLRFYHLFGLYEKKHKICSDFILLQKVLYNSYPYVLFDDFLVEVMPGGLSQQPRNSFTILRELCYLPTFKAESLKYKFLLISYIFRNFFNILLRRFV